MKIDQGGNSFTRGAAGGGSGGGGGLGFPALVTGTNSASSASANNYGLSVQATLNQTSTANFTDFLVNRTNTAHGSGAQLLMDLQVGSTSVCKVDTTGKLNFSSNVYLNPNGPGGSRLFIGANGQDQLSIYGDAGLASQVAISNSTYFTPLSDGGCILGRDNQRGAGFILRWTRGLFKSNGLSIGGDGSNDNGAQIITIGSGGVENLALSPPGGLVTTNTAGQTFAVKSGTNAMSGTVTLSSGAATIASNAITANTVICFSLKTSSGTPGTYPPLAAVAANSATVTGAATDNSTYNWVGFVVN